MVSLGSGISIFIRIFVSLVAIHAPLGIVAIVIWLGSANLGINFAFPSKENFLAKLASVEV